MSNSSQNDVISWEIPLPSGAPNGVIRAHKVALLSYITFLLNRPRARKKVDIKKWTSGLFFVIFFNAFVPCFDMINASVK